MSEEKKEQTELRKGEEVPVPTTDEQVEEVPVKEDEPTTTTQTDVENTPVEETDSDKERQEGFHLHLHVGSLEQLRATSDEVLKIVNEVSKEATVGGVEPMLPKDVAMKMACLESPIASSAAFADTEALERGGFDGKTGELKVSHDLGTANDHELSGDNAILALTSIVQGVRKIYLYNSGFYIVVKPFNMEQLDASMVSLGKEDEELGRTLGYYRFLYNNVYIKERFLQLLASNVIACNVKGWKNNNHFLKLISYHDYPVLLWAMCCAMHEDPIKVSAICLNCTHVKETEYDLTKMCLLNNKVLTPMALSFLYEEKQGLTSEDLKAYREEMLDGYNFTRKFNHNGFDWELEMHVPMLATHIVNGKKNIGSIVSSLNSKNSMKDKEVFNKTILRFQSNYTPWITKITLTKNGKVVFKSKDKNIFDKALQLLGHDEASSAAHDEIMNSLVDSAAAVIGSVASPCEECGNSLGNNGFIAWDPEQLFFDLTSHTLSGLLK